MRGYVEINPKRKNYGYLNLTKDAIVTDIRVNESNNQVEVYFESNSGEIYESDGIFGFEYTAYRENEDINITIIMKAEQRKVVYAKVIKCNKETFFVIITRWMKQ